MTSASCWKIGTALLSDWIERVFVFHWADNGALESDRKLEKLDQAEGTLQDKELDQLVEFVMQSINHRKKGQRASQRALDFQLQRVANAICLKPFSITTVTAAEQL